MIVRDARQSGRDPLQVALEDSIIAQAILDVSPLPILSIDLDGNITKWNPAAERVFGWSREEVIGRHIPIILEKAQPSSEELLGEALSGRTLEGLDVRRVRKDGSRIDLSLSAAPLRNAAGAVTGAMAVYVDVTERKRAEAEHAELAAIVESSHDAVIGKTLDGLITSWNRGAEVLYGYRSEEVLGRSVSILIPEDQEDEMPGILAKLRRGERIDHFETTRLRKDGTQLTASLSVSPIVAPDGRILGASAIARDITEQQRARAKELQQRLNTDLERLLAERTVQLEAEVQQRLNADIERLLTERTVQLEVEVQQRLKADVERLLAERTVQLEVEVQQRLNADVERLLTERTVQLEVEVQQRLKADLERLLAERTVQLEVEVQQRLNADVERLFTERTVQVEAEVQQRLKADLERLVAERTVQLEASNKELAAFTYAVSHDLRAPLRAVDGFSKALLEDYADALEGDGADFLKRIRAGTQRMSRLIEDLLRLSRQTHGELQLEQVDLSELVQSIIDGFRQSTPDRNVSLVGQDGLTVRGDNRLLRIALENLLGNAWKFTQNHSSAQIEFGMSEQGGESVYFVRDDGAGFDMRHADKLFGSFQRLHTTAEFEGTGVGLTTVQRIIQRHGGRIWAEATPEQGATFYFTLSAVGHEVEESHAQEPENH
jgi:PAS domain S-box-containing protein